MNKPKLLFLCSKFGGGGAEMHLLRVLTHVDFSRYDIHLALTRAGGNFEERLPPEVTIHHLNSTIGSSTKALLKSVMPLKKVIGDVKPAAIISFMDPQNVLLAFLKLISFGEFPPVVICCQNAIEKNLSNEGALGKFYLSVIPGLYKRADKIIAICKGVGTELSSIVKQKVPVEVIYNAGFDQNFQDRINEGLPQGISPKENQLLACGRLTRQKGFDTLINALHLIKDEIPFNLWLLGEGEDREKLTQLVDKLGLNDRIQFVGFQANPYPFFHNADVFVLSSLWEGFGNVITEAMACKTAVVSTRCDFGPDEIITDGVNGILCDVASAADLAKSIKQILSDVKLRENIAEQGNIRSASFASKQISQQYIDSISAIIG